MKVRSRVVAGVLVVILAIALVPTVAVAAGYSKAALKGGVVVPPWMTDVINQVKAIAQEAAAQLKPIYEQAMTQVQQALAGAWAQLKGVTDPALARVILDQLKAQLKVTYDKAVADATPIILAAATQIRAILAQAWSKSAGLNAKVKAKVRGILAGLKKYTPKLAF